MDTPKETAEELKERLSPDQYHITQQAGTEPAFSGCYWDTKEEGAYHCIVCDTELFFSETKYDSGTGWPSFFEATNNDKVSRVEDHSHGMVRTEAICATCGSHLGHIFKDGPPPSGERFCMNSASLRLQPTLDS